MASEQTTIGVRLREAREARGTSLRQIADATKLSVRMLEALERGKTAYLPGGIYRRSIVRSYAREIGLDPEDTLRDYLREFPDDLPAPGTPSSEIAFATEPIAVSGSRSWLDVALRLSNPLVAAAALVIRRL